MYSCTLVLMHSCTLLVNVCHTAPASISTKNISVYILYISGPANNLKILATPTECLLHPHPDSVARPRGRQCHPGSSSQRHPQCRADTVSAPPRQRGHPPHRRMSAVLSHPKLSPLKLTGPKYAAAVQAAASAAATLFLSPGCKACCYQKPAGCYTQGN